MSEELADEFLRDYIASKVLASLVVQVGDFDVRGLDWHAIARVAYQAADAMMEVRQA